MASSTTLSSRDAFEDVVGRRGRDELAVADHDDVFAAAFRDVAVAVQHDRFVEAVEVGLGLCEGGVDVDAGPLGARRDAGVLDAAPGARVAARNFGETRPGMG